ncbi:hypothetical protein ACH5RR_025957 [Cinchona calisaya]|uniref:Uncharacterized protein n=1 Tax=Cinchona calisaya TaxID=153742 RepID=A0ABD2Z4I1_9GENT
MSGKEMRLQRIELEMHYLVTQINDFVNDESYQSRMKMNTMTNSRKIQMNKRFLTVKKVVYEDLVMQFYANLRKVGNSLVTMVNVVEIEFDFATINSILGYPNEGSDRCSPKMQSSLVNVFEFQPICYPNQDLWSSELWCLCDGLYAIVKAQEQELALCLKSKICTRLEREGKQLNRIEMKLEFVMKELENENVQGKENCKKPRHDNA